MKKTTNEPIVLWSDQTKIDDMKTRLEILRILAQKAVDTFNTLNLPDTANIPLETILDGSQILINRYLKSKMPESVDIGMKINRDKALALGLVELEGRDAFNDALVAFKASPDISHISNLTLENGTVSISSERWQSFVAQNSVIASTPAQLELYRKWQHVIDVINNFTDYVSDHHQVRFIHGLTLIQPERWFILDRDKKLIINHSAFQQFFRPRTNRIAQNVD